MQSDNQTATTTLSLSNNIEMNDETLLTRKVVVRNATAVDTVIRSVEA